MFTQTTFPAISLFLVYATIKVFLVGEPLQNFCFEIAWLGMSSKLYIYIQLIRDVSREQNFISAVAYEAFDNRGNF